MRYRRLATFILVAGLGLVSGCRSNPCEGGLMSRFGWSRSRPAPIYDSNVVGSPVVGTPVSAMPYGGTPYGGTQWGGEMPYEGPALGDPTFMGTPTTIMPNMTVPGGMSPIPGGSTLPPPMAGSDGVLRPVPGTARPLPADPSSRSRW